jgi:hypothetical protein
VWLAPPSSSRLGEQTARTKEKTTSTHAPVPDLNSSFTPNGDTLRGFPITSSDTIYPVLSTGA